MRIGIFIALLGTTVLAGCSTPGPGSLQPRAEYDADTGRLRRFEFDSNRDGRYDTVSVMDGTRIVRVETDGDGNGKVERWDFYTAERTLAKVGFSSRNDGVMDSQAFYDTAGTLQRLEISTKHDGRFDRTEFYAGGRLVQSGDDTNADGRADKWDAYEPVAHPAPGAPAYAIVSTSFDDSGSGRPERRFVYGPNGSIARVEVDVRHSGTWTPQTSPSASAALAKAR